MLGFECSAHFLSAHELQVRIPASYCGVLGFRPSAGRITLEGARPLAPTFDSVGW
jgi:hypothetical protein